MSKYKKLRNKAEDKKIERIQKLHDDMLSQVCGGYITYRSEKDGKGTYKVFDAETHELKLTTDDCHKAACYDEELNGFYSIKC